MCFGKKRYLCSPTFKSFDMERTIKYPIGIQTFEKIREGNYLYVDKTALVYRLVNSKDYVFLSRPRRFGKSLLLSTIEAYFQGRKELFEGLAVEKLETEWLQHPVLRIDLSGESYNSPERLKLKLNAIISDWEKLYGCDESKQTLGTRFAAVIRNVCEQTGQKVVILIDEYDKPLLENLHDDEGFEHFREELRGFYSVIKESDRYIRFAMLTGVTKFGHLSVFSGLNNLNDISFDDEYNALCGISETEFRRDFQESVAAFALAGSKTEDEVWDGFKTNYDGYHFSRVGEGIYNPFSVMLAFDKKRFGSFWFGTGTPEFLVKLLKRNNYPLWQLEGVKQSEGELQDMTISRANLVPLLYQSGYLSIKGYDDDSDRYILGFPNREVSKGFWEALYKGYIQPQISTSFDLDQFVGDVNSGNPQGFMERLNSLLASVSPGNSANREVHFQNELQVIFKMLGFRTQCEVRSSFGRADMIVQTRDYIYIFEFKVDATAREALFQIDSKGYAAQFAADSRRLFKIGASFCSKTCTLAEYLIEE